jgi:hypothetical protein
MQLGKRNMAQSKSFPYFNLGEQFSRKLSLREVPAKNQNVFRTFEWMKMDENRQQTTYRNSGIER